MKISTSLFSFLFSLLLLTACQQKTDVYLSISIPQNIKFIGHKGSGTINENGNINLQENTWEAIANAMNNIDGSEIDIQMSADSTLWIFHDYEILNCEDSLINFFLCSDEEILEINKCNYENELINLSSFLSKAKLESWESKTVCLDLKLLYNSELDQSSNGVNQLLDFIGSKLLNKFEDSQLDVHMEVTNEHHYLYFDSIFKGKSFLVNHNPTISFVQKMNEKDRSLSLPIYELDKNYKDLELDIDNLWTINSTNQFIKSLPYQPRILQSDNIPLMAFFKSLQEGRKAKRIAVNEHHIKTEDNDFFPLSTLSLPLSKDILLHFETAAEDFPEQVFLTFSAFTKEGESKDWIGLELSEFKDGYRFINSEYLEYLGASEVKISIWNKDINSLNHKLKLSQYVLE